MLHNKVCVWERCTAFSLNFLNKCLKPHEKYDIFNISKYKQKDPGLKAEKKATSHFKNRSTPYVENL